MMYVSIPGWLLFWDKQSIGGLLFHGLSLVPL